MLLDPKKIELTDINGKTREYMIGKIPLMAGGREIASQYVLPNRVDADQYEENQRLSRIIYKNTAVLLPDGSQLILETDELINNHVTDAALAIELETEVFEYNTGFSVTGRVQGFQQALLEALPKLSAETLTHLRDSSLPSEPPTSTNSEPSIQ